MKPYYEANGIELYLGDCRDVLPSLTPESVQLIVTDPPYGVQWQSTRRQERFAFIAGDESTDIARIGLALAVPVLVNHRHMYVFGRFDLAHLPIGPIAELIWDKQLLGMGTAGSGWVAQHEYIQFAVVVNAPAGRAMNDGLHAARLRRGTILRHTRHNANGVQRHPTEKPVPLLRELIEMSSRIGETVLDPFAGVGSTLVAAQLEGRKAIGIEIEEKYCEIAARRLSQQVMIFEDER